MKPINEIRFLLFFLIFNILVIIFSEYFPAGCGWIGIRNMVFIFFSAFSLDYFITTILIAFKKWWKEQ